MIDHCYYHEADLDGKCSAAIVKYFNPDVKLIAWNYNKKFDFTEYIKKSYTVCMIDVSLPFKEMLKLRDLTSLIYIDHHKTILDQLKGFTFNGIQDETTAACILTWKYFSLEPVPSAVDLLGMYDVWDISDYTLYFQYAMRALDGEPDSDIWPWLFKHPSIKDLENIIESGKMIYDYQEKQDIMSHHSMIQFKFRGLNVLALNRLAGSSLIFQHHQLYTLSDILMVFGWNGKWKVSMYTTKDEIDVGEICKEFGGGGHKKASGFFAVELPKEIHSGIFGGI